MTPAQHRAVRPYGEALQQLAAGEGGEAEMWKDLESLAQLWDQLPELDRLLTHPGVAPQVKDAFLVAALTEKVHPYVLNAVRLLVRRGRASLVPALRTCFLQVTEERGSLVRVVVRTARPLPPAGQDELARRLAGALGRPVALEVEEQPELLAGAELEVAGRRLDATVAGRLSRLAAQLRG
ncbi:MAG: ATP synthase F1 subunit delta [Candidatus Bipolaricaulaceae bacterium]